MEDGLVLAEKLSNKMLNNEVLILIVVEDGLVRMVAEKLSNKMLS